MTAVRKKFVLSLSGNALEKICLFVTCKSLLHLSEVSKSAKEIVHRSIKARKKRPNVDGFCVFDDGLVLNLQNSIDVLLWEAYLLSDQTLPIKVRITGRVYMNVGVSEGSMIMFLDFLKPLILRCHFDIVEFGHVKPEILDKCSDLFERHNINLLQLWHQNGEYTYESSSLQLISEAGFIQKCRPEEVHYAGKLANEDFIKFLLQSSSFVKTIYVFLKEKYDTMNIAREMSRSKLKTLTLGGSGSSPISLFDAEKLIQYFTHSEQRMSFHTGIDAPAMLNFIGRFRFEVIHYMNHSSGMSIDHLN